MSPDDDDLAAQSFILGARVLARCKDLKVDATVQKSLYDTLEGIVAGDETTIDSGAEIAIRRPDLDPAELEEVLRDTREDEKDLAKRILRRLDGRG